MEYFVELGYFVNGTHRGYIDRTTIKACDLQTAQQIASEWADAKLEKCEEQIDGEWTQCKDYSNGNHLNPKPVNQYRKNPRPKPIPDDMDSVTFARNHLTFPTIFLIPQ